MRSRAAALAVLYLKSSFGLNLPTKAELKKPKTLIKTIAIGIGILLLVADICLLFVMMNLATYEGLRSIGMQGLMLLNSATTAAVLLFVLGFIMALSMFSMSGIESGFLCMPFTVSEILAAKMILVYASQALFGLFIIAIAAIIYGIKENPPIMFYVNALLSAVALPLIPTAIAYLILIPLMKASKFFRNKNFILYVGGLLGISVSIVFNVYIQSSMARMHNPEALAKLAGPESFISKFGMAWPPSWLVWKSLESAGNPGGALAAVANLGLGLVAWFIVALLLGNSYIDALRAFGETTFIRGKKSALLKAGPEGVVRAGSASSRFYSLALREIRLMNREPMYLLNGPFIVIILPIIMAMSYIVQPEGMAQLETAIAPLMAGPAAYLVPAGFGAFLASSTSIACTSISRDSKALSWMKALPVSAIEFFMAKFVHAEVFSLLGAAIGAVGGALALSIGVADTILAFVLAVAFSTAFNMYALWLDAANPRLRWDNPIAAMKQNPNAVIGILGAMGIVGGFGALAATVSMPRYAFAAIFGAFFVALIVAWVVLFPRYAKKRYQELEG